MSQRERMRSRIGVNASNLSTHDVPSRNIDAPKVELKIDELLLEGFNPSDRYQIGDAVQSELEQIFAQQGGPSTINKSIELASLDGGQLSMTPSTRAATVGYELAQSVYQGISRIGSDDQYTSSRSAKIVTGEDRNR